MLLDTNSLSAPSTPGNKAKKEKVLFCISAISWDDSPPQNGPLPPKGIDFHSACPGLLFAFLFFVFFAFMQADSVSAVTRRRSAVDKPCRPRQVTYQKDTRITFGRK